MRHGRMETLVCAQCGNAFAKAVGQANRQRRVLGANVRFYCTRQCFGTARRDNKTKAQLVAEKAEYDGQYREKNRDMLKAKKIAWHRQKYDPEAARVKRAQNAEWQRAYGAEYRANPEWIAHKVEYDRKHRAAEYGPFAECHILLIELEKAVRVQPWYERAKERGYYDNDRQTNQRKRNEQISRW